MLFTETAELIKLNIKEFIKEVGELNLKRFLVRRGKNIVNMKISTMMDSSFNHDFKMPAGFDLSQPVLNIGNTVIVLDESKLWSGKTFDSNVLIAANVLIELAFLTWLDTLWVNKLNSVPSFHFGDKRLDIEQKENGIWICCVSKNDQEAEILIPYALKVDEACQMVANMFKDFIYIENENSVWDGLIDILVPASVGKSPTIVVKHIDLYKKLVY